MLLKMWLNYPPIARERVYLHRLTIIRIRTAQNSDLAGFKVTIKCLMAFRKAVFWMLLSLLFSFQCQLDLFSRKQIRLFSWGDGWFSDSSFSVFSYSATHSLPSWHRWGEFQEHIKALGLRCGHTLFLCFWEIVVSSQHLLNSSYCERSNLANSVFSWSRIPHKAPFCVKQDVL